MVGMAFPKPGTEIPSPGTGIPSPGTGIPKPGTEIPKPGTEISKPGTEISKPGTEISKPGTEIPSPGTEIPSPGTEISSPGTEISKPATGSLARRGGAGEGSERHGRLQTLRSPAVSAFPKINLKKTFAFCQLHTNFAAEKRRNDVNKGYSKRAAHRAWRANSKDYQRRAADR